LSRNNAEYFAQLDEDRYLGKVWARERAEKQKLQDERMHIMLSPSSELDFCERITKAKALLSKLFHGAWTDEQYAKVLTEVIELTTDALSEKTDPEHGPATPEQVRQVLQAMQDSEHFATCYYCKRERLDCLPFRVLSGNKAISDVCGACRWTRTIRGPGGPKPRDKVRVERLRAIVSTLSERKAFAEDNSARQFSDRREYSQEKGRAEALGEAIQLLEAVINEAQV
jgi:hypothetical protein